MLSFGGQGGGEVVTTLTTGVGWTGSGVGAAAGTIGGGEVVTTIPTDGGANSYGYSLPWPAAGEWELRATARVTGSTSSRAVGYAWATWGVAGAGGALGFRVAADGGYQLVTTIGGFRAIASASGVAVDGSVALRLVVEGQRARAYRNGALWCDLDVGELLGLGAPVDVRCQAQNESGTLPTVGVFRWSAVSVR